MAQRIVHASVPSHLHQACDSPYVGEETSFTDTPTADIQVRFRDGGSGETHLSPAPITCDNTTGTTDNDNTTNWNNTTTVTGINVTGLVTVTCTIPIDP